MRPDLIRRGAVALAALVSGLTGAPRAVTGVLTFAALLLAGERLVRRRRLGSLDALLLLVGSVLVVLVLVGLVLGATPIGLRTSTWAVALSVVAGLGLAVCTRHTEWSSDSAEPAHPGTRTAVARTLPWLAASLAVAVVAVTLSVRSVDSTEAAPLQMSLGHVVGTKVDVAVTASTAVGPLEVRTSRAGDDISYPLFTVPAGGSVTTTLALPRSGRYVITLNYPDQAQPLRTLTLDR